MIVTVLIDNKKISNCPKLVTESGLSLHISAMGKNILFDLGASNKFLHNANVLDIKMEDVDAAVVSHRHHDHCSGIGHFLEKNKKSKVFLRDCNSKDYLFRLSKLTKNISSRSLLLHSKSRRFRYTSGVVEIYSNIFIVNEISNKYKRPEGNKYIYSKADNHINKDSFDHELMMVIREEDGLVIFTGCAHSGVLNMVHTTVNLFPNTRIKAIIGGFHLVGLPLFSWTIGSREEVTFLANELLNYPIGALYTGHCTGSKAYKILRGILGNRIEQIPTGCRVEI